MLINAGDLNQVKTNGLEGICQEVCDASGALSQAAYQMFPSGLLVTWITEAASLEQVSDLMSSVG